MFKMTWYTVKKKDAYGFVIYQKSPFTPPKDEKNNDVESLRKKKSIPKHKNLEEIQNQTAIR